MINQNFLFSFFLLYFYLVFNLQLRFFSASPCTFLFKFLDGYYLYFPIFYYYLITVHYNFFDRSCCVMAAFKGILALGIKLGITGW